MHATKIFDTSTIQGLKAAECFKAKLNKKFERVEVKPIGLNRVQIMGFESKALAGVDSWSIAVDDFRK